MLEDSVQRSASWYYDAIRVIDVSAVLVLPLYLATVLRFTGREKPTAASHGRISANTAGSGLTVLDTIGALNDPAGVKATSSM